MLKLWCKSNTRYLSVLTSRLRKMTNSFTYLRSLWWMIQVPRTTQSQMTDWMECFTNCQFLCYIFIIPFVSLTDFWPFFVAFFQLQINLTANK